MLKPIFHFTLFICFACLVACSPRNATDLSPIINTSFNEGWTFAQAGARADLMRAAIVPGCVQLDLQRHDLLDDPLVATNELAATWVEEKEWIYEKHFSLSELPKRDSIEFHFECLETFCEIELNGNKVGESNSAFLPFRFSLARKELAKENILRLKFLSTKEKAIELAGNSILGKTAGNDSGDPKLSPFVRKPAFHFGWDWGPRVVSTGITGTVSVQAFNKRPELTKPRAFQKEVQLVSETDSIGTSFYFTKNGEPFFVRGANYIPLSMYRAVPTDEDYRKLLKQVKSTGMNMLRVWGGGMYEKDIFYELCDSLDILVWQDFMFAGAMYPSDEAFLAQVKEEADYQKQRLSKYKNVVLWCGNNEVDVAWKNWGWQGVLEQDSLSLQTQYDKLFQETLSDCDLNHSSNSGAQCVACTCENYIHSSPLSNWGKLDNFNHHNMHYWGVWHGPDNFDGFEKYVPRFMSEYGFQSFPMPWTFEGQVATEDLQLESEAMQHRQKSYKENKELIRHLVQHYPLSEDFTEFCYLSQLNQALAMEMAIKAQRSSGGHCMGTLYWQLNDVWAAPTWSTIDFKGNWKVAHYSVKDLYKEQIVIPKKVEGGIEIHLSNHGSTVEEYVLECKLVSFDGTQLWSSKREISAKANKDELIHFLSLQELGLERINTKQCVLRLSLNNGEQVIDHAEYYFQEPKDLELPRISENNVSIEALGNNKYKVEAHKFVKDMFLHFPDAAQQSFSANALDLLPGESIVVEYLGAKQTGLPSFMCLNNLQ